MGHQCISLNSLQPLNQCEAGDWTEAEIIRLAQKGDPAAFEGLYRLHKKRVYGLCLRMLGSISEAQDSTQEVFLQVFRKIHTFRGESAFSTWLHRLSVNIVLMRLRKKTLLEIPLEINAEEEEYAWPQQEFGAPDPVLSGLVDHMDLERAISKLPPGYKQVFLLHDVEGYEHAEIAEMLGCSSGNSKSQLHKARMQLRHFLQRIRMEVFQAVG